MIKSNNSFDDGSTDTDCAETSYVFKKSSSQSKADGEEKEREPLQKGVTRNLKKQQKKTSSPVKKTSAPIKKLKSGILNARTLNILLLWIIIGLVILVIVGYTSNCTGDETETKCKISSPCEDDWIYYRGKCYYFSTEHNTWTNSQKFCKSHDASLVHIDNKEEYDFLFRYKGKANHWIGIRRTEDNKDWTWTNGTIYNESLFPIKRSFEGNIEFAYLNTGDVRSHEDSTRVHWICAKI